MALSFLRARLRMATQRRRRTDVAGHREVIETDGNIPAGGFCDRGVGKESIAETDRRASEQRGFAV